LVAAFLIVSVASFDTSGLSLTEKCLRALTAFDHDNATTKAILDSFNTCKDTAPVNESIIACLPVDANNETSLNSVEESCITQAIAGCNDVAMSSCADHGYKTCSIQTAAGLSVFTACFPTECTDNKDENAVTNLLTGGHGNLVVSDLFFGDMAISCSPSGESGNNESSLSVTCLQGLDAMDKSNDVDPIMSTYQTCAHNHAPDDVVFSQCINGTDGNTTILSNERQHCITNLLSTCNSNAKAACEGDSYGTCYLETDGGFSVFATCIPTQCSDSDVTTFEDLITNGNGNNFGSIPGLGVVHIRCIKKNTSAAVSTSIALGAIVFLLASSLRAFF